MSYSKTDYQKAFGQVNASKEKAFREAEIRRNRLINDYPEYEAIEHEISKTVIEVTRSVLAGTTSADEIEKIMEKNLILQRKKEEILLAAGKNKDYLNPVYSCSKCNDSGYYQGTMCDCVKRIAMKITYDRLNSITPLDHSSFDNFKLEYYPDTEDDNGIVARKRMNKNYKYCYDYAHRFSTSSESLLFMGKTGLGKTHLSLSIANVVIEKGYNVIYGPISHLLRSVEEEHFSRDKNDSYTIKTIINCDLLILDDLGVEFLSGFTTSMIYEIINSRILNHKPTIINTNLNFNELQERYTPRIVSRLSGNYQTLTFFGTDIREKL
ncbi:MAG: hypothetical protein BGN88_07105 [Clostridiales bacterium 43-6]|nr:MAG: hypothetical protein BGN88_07105 [Clostridiales bacterium 43-6]